MDEQDERSAHLMTFNEAMLPVIEWAEGQRAFLIERGWSADSADRYAAELLLGMTRATFANAETRS